MSMFIDMEDVFPAFFVLRHFGINLSTPNIWDVKRIYHPLTNLISKQQQINCHARSTVFFHRPQVCIFIDNIILSSRNLGGQFCGLENSVTPQDCTKDMKPGKQNIVEDKTKRKGGNESSVLHNVILLTITAWSYNFIPKDLSTLSTIISKIIFGAKLRRWHGWIMYTYFPLFEITIGHCQAVLHTSLLRLNNSWPAS